MNFKLDLEFGNTFEKKLLDFVEHDTYIIKEGYFPDYDIEIKKDNVIKKYEVKADRYAYKTNQCVIEFECNNKASGIRISKSDYYAYFVVKPYNLFDLYIIPTQLIKDEINIQSYKRIVIGGDNKASKMYVFDLSLFNEYKINI
jgi:hypothetical protein